MINISINEKPFLDLAKSAVEAVDNITHIFEDKAADVAYYASFAANTYTVMTGSFFNFTNLALSAIAMAHLAYVDFKNEDLPKEQWDKVEYKKTQIAKSNILSNLSFGVLGFNKINALCTLSHALSDHVKISIKQ